MINLLGLRRVQQNGMPNLGVNRMAHRDQGRLFLDGLNFRRLPPYPTSGPASGPVPQEILRWWEKCAREGSLIINHAAGFNRCTSEVQEKMNQHISLFHETVVKGKAPKEVVEAIKELKDLSAFHTSVSIALGTAFQHLADGLFVQLANFVLLRRDSYLEYVKPGLKPDMWNKLRNAPLFTYGLFPDDVLAVAEQDILKHESTRGASGPNKQSSYSSSQTQQAWRQFSGRGRGGAGEEVALVPHIFQSLQGIPSSINDKVL